MPDDTAVIAVPSDWPGGVQASAETRFSRCDCFTVLIVEKGQLQYTMVLPNPPNRDSSCARRIEVLKSFKADTVIVSGLGNRTCKRFEQVGIKVLRTCEGDVRCVLDRYLSGDLEQLRCGEGCERLPEGVGMEACPMKDQPLEEVCTCPYGGCV